MVIVIIGILAGVVALNVMNAPDEASATATRAQITNLETALKQYKLRFRSFPTSAQGLNALVAKPTRAPVPKQDYPAGGFLDSETVPLDGWKNPFVYSYDPATRRYEIVSYGADGEVGGDGPSTDISSRDP